MNCICKIFIDETLHTHYHFVVCKYMLFTQKELRVEPTNIHYYIVIDVVGSETAESFTKSARFSESFEVFDLSIFVVTFLLLKFVIFHRVTWVHFLELHSFGWCRLVHLVDFGFRYFIEVFYYPFSCFSVVPPNFYSLSTGLRRNSESKIYWANGVDVFLKLNASQHGQLQWFWLRWPHIFFKVFGRVVCKACVFFACNGKTSFVFFHRGKLRVSCWFCCHFYLLIKTSFFNNFTVYYFLNLVIKRGDWLINHACRFTWATQAIFDYARGV